MNKSQQLYDRFSLARLLPLAAIVAVLSCPCSAFADTSAREVADAKSQYDSLVDDAEQANEQLNQTKSKIDDIDRQISDIEASISDDRESLAAQVRGSYKSCGASNPMLSVLTSSSLSDAASNLQYALKIQQRNEDAIDKVRDSEASLTAAKDEQQDLLSQQQSQSDELQAKADDAKSYYDGLNSELRAQLGIDDDTSVPENVSSGTGEAWRDAVLLEAYANLGGSYVWGGEAFKACDCSGLVMLCYAQVGVSLPHSSESQAAYCNKPISEAVPGDIVYRYGHVGIYIGDGETIEAHSPSRGIGYGVLSSFTSCGSPLS